MKQRRFLPYLIFLLITYLVAGLSSVFVVQGLPAYEKVLKPPLTPPSILFPIVWSILYFLMSVAAARVWNSSQTDRLEAAILYAEQLMLNGLWSLWFFGAQLYLLALVWLVLLVAMVVLMASTFYKIDRLSGLIQIPYLLWCLFAGYLNFGVWLLNR